MHFYGVHSYGRMIRDGIRTGAYARALRQCVTPGSVVLDIGTGVGVLALLACQLGARKVYAVDPNDVIQIAREMAAANGYTDRIEFVQDLSTKIILPERADVIVADLHGVLPMFEESLASLIDARRRLLAPGGRMIPERETMWAAVAEAPEAYNDLSIPWSDNPLGLDMRAAMRVVTNMWCKPKGGVRTEQLLVEPRCWAALDYQRVESPNVSGEVTWTASRTGTAHGFIVWFDSFLAGGVSFSNAPGAAEVIFGNAFFPWPEPVPVFRGDTISISIHADLVGEDYVWRWDTCVLGQGCPSLIRTRFKQSTFFGATLSPANLQKRVCHHTPVLKEDGQIDRFVLSLIDGDKSLEVIARQTAAQFPERFPVWHDALARVADLSEKYSK